MPERRVVAVIGEAVADAFPRTSASGEGSLPPGRTGAGSLELEVRPGGGPANTAVALSRFGTPTRFLGRFSGGLLGRMLRDHLLGSNVDLSGSVATDGAATLAITSVDAQGRTGYDFYLTGTTDWQWEATELHPGVLTGVCCVHTGSLALALPPGGPLIEDLLATARRDCLVSIDPNVRPGIVAPQAYRDAMRRWSTLADIIRLSDEDLAVLRPDGDFDATCAEWHAAGVRLVVLTRGPHGATASLDGVQLSVPAVPVSVVDTVGAGDAFTAGLLDHLWRRGRLAPGAFAAAADEIAAAMRFAAVVAARVCAVRGADPPWRDELAPVPD
ncbi:MAG: carbohydrate kinase [Micromonosporaceae bacterium]|nr:carbohydrate kinase [Micromonosporaceae bacterium]